MQIKIKIDIPDADYAILTKWLKHYGAENTVQNTLEHGIGLDLKRMLPKARKHMETGKSAYERFREGVLKESSDE